MQCRHNRSCFSWCRIPICWHFNQRCKLFWPFKIHVCDEQTHKPTNQYGVKLWKSKENINNNKINSWVWTLANGKKWTTNTKCYSGKGIFNWNNLPFRHGLFFYLNRIFWCFFFQFGLNFFSAHDKGHAWPMVCAHTCQEKIGKILFITLRSVYIRESIEFLNMVSMCLSTVWIRNIFVEYVQIYLQDMKLIFEFSFFSLFSRKNSEHTKPIVWTKSKSLSNRFTEYFLMLQGYGCGMAVFNMKFRNFSYQSNEINKPSITLIFHPFTALPAVLIVAYNEVTYERFVIVTEHRIQKPKACMVSKKMTWKTQIHSYTYIVK